MNFEGTESIKESGYSLAEKALAMCSASGVRYASVAYRLSDELGMFFKNGSLSVISPEVDYGISVRVATSVGIGFAATNNMSIQGARKAVKDALSMARACNGKVPDLNTGHTEKADWTAGQKTRFDSLDTELKIKRISELDKTIKSGTELKSFRQIGYSENTSSNYYIDTEGTRIKASCPRLEVSYFLMLQSGADSEQAHRQLGYTGGLEALEALEVEAQGTQDVKALETMLRRGKTFKGEKMDLVCGSEVTGIACHESCGHPMEADRILGREASQAGKSFVKRDSIGKNVGSDLVTIVDDPTIPNSFGHYVYDDEGVKARARVLYEKGKIKEFLQNRESGAKTGMSSNGAGRASSYGVEPLVRMANTYLLPGDWSDEEIVGEVSHGVLLKSFNEWNIDDRRYNQKYVGREAYMIEKGQVTAPVRSPILEITTPGFWTAVDAVGKNVRFYGGTCGKGDPMQGMEVNMGGPMIRLRNVVLK